MPESNSQIKIFKFVGGDSAKVAAYTGDDKTIVINADTHRIHVQDGKTAGGTPLARMADLPNDASQIKYTEEQTVAQALADLLYKKIEITSLSTNVPTQEMGATVTDVTVSWGLSYSPAALTLNDEVVDVGERKKTFTGQRITTNTTYTLKATDARNAVAQKSVTINFMNGAYYGKGSVNADGITNEFVQTLTKTLTNSKARDFTVNAGEGEFIYYAIPHRLGTPTFFVGGFEGGFGLEKTFDFTNASGYTESYDVYKSGNANLGNTTVTAK